MGTHFDPIFTFLKFNGVFYPISISYLFRIIVKPFISSWLS